MSDARRLATLVACATVAVQRGQDDALEHFERLHGELQLRVRKQGERERLRYGQEIDRAGLTLAEACETPCVDTAPVGHGQHQKKASIPEATRHPALAVSSKK